MNLRKLYALLLILPLLVAFTACDDNSTEPEVTVNEAEVLVKFLEENGDFINTAAPAMIKATDVFANVASGADQVVIDIRAADAYADGHIQGAVNVEAGKVLEYYETNNLQNKELVVIACYSGQTAGWVTGLMRLMGYDNVKDLKWGMCSWNPETAGSWPSNIGNAKAAEFVTTETAKPDKGSLPKLSTGKTNGAEILRARVETVFEEGFGEAKIKNSDVYADLDGHFIVNYWKAEHYATGHIAGAMQYTPNQSMRLEADLKTLSTEKPVVVYCYTGQTSAHMAAFLRVVGYNAKSLLFGVNGMSYDAMPGTKWAPDQIHEYDLVK